MRYLIASFVLIGTLQLAASQSDVGATLARAEALYYEARFRESIDLLAPLDSSLLSQPGRLQEKINIKLNLALAHIGLSETNEAKSRFAELSALDPDYSLDPARFSPKVISIFQEAKAEHDAAACQTVCRTAADLSGKGDPEALIAYFESARSNCGCLRETAQAAAAQYYQVGMDAYRKENFAGALEDFRLAVRLSPQQQLAAEYINLTQDKLRLAAERSFLEWRAAFDAREFVAASEDFHRLESYNIGGVAADSLERMRTQYRQTLSALVESWDRACAKGDTLAMESVRRQAVEMLPDPAIGMDLVDQMKACMKDQCLQMQAQVAMSRLKIRVNPRIPGALPSRALTVRVNVRIDAEGNVTIIETQGGGSSAVRNAVQDAIARWKFLPAIVDRKARCVETEIPIVLAP